MENKVLQVILILRLFKFYYIININDNSIYC